MIKDKINTIIDSLTSLTKSNLLNWEEKEPSSNKRDHRREYFAKGEDGTLYEIEIKYNLSTHGVWCLERDMSIWIRSDKLPNGSFYVSGYGDYDTLKLRELVMAKYCKDMKPSEKIVEDALDSISNGINIIEARDSKLNKILNVFGLSGK
jgi:hypothetical protein